MNIIDALIILTLLAGAVLGFKKGVIHSAVHFVGTIIVIVLAYALKNPLSTILYTHLPFMDLKGIFEGVSVINILIYEAISFLIVFAILMAILKGILLFTGIIEKILRFTIILGIPSKILGAILGFLEAYLLIFVALFAINQFNILSSEMEESKYAKNIIQRTPLFSKGVSKAFGSIEEIYSLKDKYQQIQDKAQYNMEALDILLKYEVITPSSAKKLVEKGKLPEEARNIINNYGKD